MKRQKPSHSKMLEKQEIKMNSFPVLLRERKSKIRFPTGHSQQEPLLGWRRPDHFSPSYKPREKAVRRSHRGPSSAAAVACQSPERVTGGDDAAVGRDLSLGADTACDAGARALGAMWVLGSAGERSRRVRGSAWHSPHFPLGGSAPEG